MIGRLLCAIAVALGLGAAGAQTQGGTAIVNQASASYSLAGTPQPPRASNAVTTVVPRICDLEITPNGTPAAPGQTRLALPGEVVLLSYRLRNTGNAAHSYVLAAILLPESSLTPLSLRLWHDRDETGSIEPGDPEVDSLTLEPGEAAQLLLELRLPEDYAAAGVALVNLLGRCSEAPDIVDDDNVAAVTVPIGGVLKLAKNAEPAPGSVLAPGAALSYTIDLTVAERPLDSLTISDTLDALLDDSALIAGSGVLELRLNDAVVPHVASYDPVSRTVSATLTNLNPGDRVSLTIPVAVRSDAPGNAIIANQAVVVHDGGAQRTPEIRHTVAGLCRLTVTPSGTVAAPAYQRLALPGERLLLPYTLTNSGNLTSRYRLSAEQLAGELTPALAVVAEDGVTELSELTLAPNQSAALKLAVTLSPAPLQLGDAFVTLQVACADDPAVQSRDHVARVSVPLGGFSAPVKEAEPPAGTPLAPGMTLRYRIRFRANDRDLDNVVVRDTLSALLTEPLALSDGELVDPESGLSALVEASYEASSRTVSWRLARVPAGMTVVLELIAQVRSEPVGADGLIENAAIVGADGVAPTPTNTVLHPLVTPEVALMKTVDRPRATVGEVLNYTLTVANPHDALPLASLQLDDLLPDGLRYQAGSSRLQLPDGAVQPIEPEVDGQRLRWQLPPLAAGERMIVTFAASVLPAALERDELVNVATVTALGQGGVAVASATASAITALAPGILAGRAVLQGVVFIDNDDDGVFNSAVDTPVAGVRLYLADGRYAVTDQLGRYTFLDLPVGLTALRLDLTTLPSRRLRETANETSPGLWRIPLQGGLIYRQDVPLRPAGARLEVSQRLEVRRGAVTVVKRLLPEGPGRWQVVLEVTSEAPLRGLTVRDALPVGLMPAGEALVSKASIIADGLVFALGEIAAGEVVRVSYLVDSELSAEQLLLAPEISWSVRQ